MKNKVVNTVVVFLVAVFLTVLAFHVRIGATADSVAVLKTAGMTCGSCSSKISKALEALSGVAATEVDVAGGWVIVGYDTKTIKPEELAEKVTKTGFGSSVHVVLTPEQFKQITGTNIGEKAAPSKGCCGGKTGGCATKPQG